MSWWNPFSWGKNEWHSYQPRGFQPKSEIQKMIQVLGAFCDAIEQRLKYEHWDNAFANVQGSFGSMMNMLRNIESKYPPSESAHETMQDILVDIKQGNYQRQFRDTEEAMESIRRSIQRTIIPQLRNYLRELRA
ncbi:MAG TPA: hypothetical protein VJB66_04220 [Candidatus Nanoarchaeia archaeon]|nr:hypothetical protein [Candidatus Nanoarchaeia archaeon]